MAKYYGLHMCFDELVIQHYPEEINKLIKNWAGFKQIIIAGNYEWNEGWDGKKYKSHFDVPKNPAGDTYSMFRSKIYDFMEQIGIDKDALIGYWVDKQMAGGLYIIHFFETMGGC